MERRDFTLRLAGAGLACAAPAWAQAPVEGTHYIKLSQPLAATLLPPAGKIDVTEFFWYECPHCAAFEPLLDPWAKKLSADVAFRRVPVGFTARHVIAQKLFYALEQIGALEAAHRRVFTAIHGQGKRLTSDNDAITLAAESGADKAAFSDAYKSFQVNTKATKARQLADAYKVDGVPMLGLHGRYFTSAAIAGSHDRALAVADFLLQRIRKG